MHNKKIMLLAIFLVGLVAIGAASAADVAGEDNSTEINVIGAESALDSSDSTPTSANGNDDPGVDEDNGLRNLEASAQKSFADLNDTINAKPDDVIYLEENYTYDPAKDSDFVYGITIGRDVTIYGNGMTIDGANQAMIFNVTKGSATFHDLIFVNGNATGSGLNGKGGAIYNGTAINCTFINNTANLGGAICLCIAINCTFSNNTANFGGAMSGGTATNCTFFNNTARKNGGAMSAGTATNCIFTSNYAFRGGAMHKSNAINCLFSDNHADHNGGGIYDGSATNCTFSNNNAIDYGGGMYQGSATNCTFIKNLPEDHCQPSSSNGCVYLNAVCFTFSDSIFPYHSGKKLSFNVTDNHGQTLNNVFTTITVKNDTFKHTYHTLSGQGWVVDLSPGIYQVTLSVDSHNPSVTAKITVTNYSTFTELNKTINSNNASEITLYTNYAYYPDIDSEFKNGININRRLTIYGNGHILNGSNEARIFNVDGDDVALHDITFINGKAEDGMGGAIYWSGTNANIHNCNFINNTAGFGGANYFFNTLTNATITGNYTNNTARFGGANYFNYQLTNATITGNYTNNTARFGGANYFNYQLTNVAIMGDYTNNTATVYAGGANYFNDKLTNVTITGNYTNNTAENNGGANYFTDKLTNVTITGNYTNNNAKNGIGGANSYYILINATITGNYTNNKAAKNGGANQFWNTITNVAITGDYVNNTATLYGGANYFNKELDNVTITGDYTNNTANVNGGANHFNKTLTNVNITGDYTSNKANENGGANHFNKLTNVTITGNYTNNTARFGGANYFNYQLTNATITGDYTSNIARFGGANFFNYQLTNVAIMGDYTNNTATVYAGGANYFTDKLTNVTITGNYANNTAESGGANYFTDKLTNVTITGNYTNNTATVYTGGANQFWNTITNVAITGDYVNNTATLYGGANYFNKELDNVNITGDYTNNTAKVHAGGANYFSMSINNGAITGDYTNNKANENGGANYFQNTLTNVTISGDYANNTAKNGGANHFNKTLTNVSITGDYTSNKATEYFGGANYFQETLTNVAITGDYTSNTAYWQGGANYFKNTLTNATITGNYTNNKATNGNGGANFYYKELTNVAIMGDYTNNTAINGGANYFTELTNVTITGNYTNNKATNGDGGANHFSNKLNNVTITGNYTSNTATLYGGANCFYSYLINVNITGDYTSNTANANGGANYFQEPLSNVNITGDYTSNTANANGGANCFNSFLINVNITGTFTNNKATNDDGGANSFMSPLTNVTITGDYTANKANGYGGANSFLNPLTNVTISGDYTGNTACDGGANYFSKITNVNITGEYTANKALGSGGAIYFGIETNYLNVRGAFINNSGFYIIFIDKSIENNVIRDSIFLNNNAKNINLDQGDIQLVNNWFGNNATNYNVTPDTGSVTPDNWLFLNATVDPVKFTSSTNVTFKLDSYDANTKNVTDYNNNLISPIELTLTSTNATVKNSTHLNETVKYVAGDSEKGSVTATFENAEFTIELQTDKKNPQLSVESETYNYNESVALALSYNPNATGNVSVTLNGKKHNYNYTGLALNVTVMLSGDILPDEYNVTVMYGGDMNFFGTSANSTLTVKKANSTLKISDITFDYNKTGSCEVTFTNATGVSAEVIGHNEATISVTNNLITVSGLDAGNYTLSVTTITSEGYSNVTQTSKITVKPAPSLVSAEDVNVTYGEDIIIPVKSVNATEVKYEIIMKNDVVASGTVMSGENITGLRLASGTYTVNLTTVTDSNHISSSGESLLTVKRAQSLIDVNGTETYYKEDAVLNYTVVNATGIDVTITDWAENPMKEGEDYNITVTSDKIIISDLKEGKYIVNVSTVVDGNHTSTNKNVTVYVNPVCDLEIVLTPMNSTANYGDSVLWNATVISHGPSYPFNVYIDVYVPEGLIFKDSRGFPYYQNHYRIDCPFMLVPEIPFSIYINTLVNATNADLTLNVSVRDEYIHDPNPNNNNASATVKALPMADLSVEKTVSNTTVYIDDIVTWTISITNNGPDSATQVVVSDKLSELVKLINATLDGQTIDFSGRYTIPAVASGQTKVITLTASAVEVGTVKNTVSVNASEYDFNMTNNNATSEDVEIKKQTVIIDVDIPSQIDAGDSSNVTVVLPSDAEGNVSLIVDGAEVENIPLTNGSANVTLPPLSGGNHTVEIKYSGDDKYSPNAKTSVISVKRIATNLTATQVTTTYGVKKYMVITLKDEFNNPLAGVQVEVTIKGTKNFTTDSNGQIKISTKSLAPKTYTAKISFAGNENYTESNTTSKIVVKKLNSKIVAKAKGFSDINPNKKYTIVLKDTNGAAIKRVTVALKVNGVVYFAKTNNKGQATFLLKGLTKAKTYKASIYYAGSKYYNKVSAYAKITVKTAFKTVSKGSKDTATVTKIQRALKNNGYYLTYAGHYLMVDGVYGDCTERSVKEYQGDNTLKVTGSVDYTTAKKLKVI